MELGKAHGDMETGRERGPWTGRRGMGRGQTGRGQLEIGDREGGNRERETGRGEKGTRGAGISQIDMMECLQWT